MRLPILQGLAKCCAAVTREARPPATDGVERVRIATTDAR